MLVVVPIMVQIVPKKMIDLSRKRERGHDASDGSPYIRRNG